MPPDRHLDHLLDLSALVFDPGTTFTDRVMDALERERQYLGLPYGMLTHVDREADRETVVVAAGRDGVLEAGETIPLSEMYCRETVARESGQLAIEAASEEGWADDPAYRRFGLETYVGSAIEFDGDRRGTICFTGEKAREEPLDDAEVGHVTLLARWASYELGRATGHGVESSGGRLAPFADPIDPTTVDTALEILVNPIRRELLAYLSTVDGPVSVSAAADHLAATGGIASRPRQRIEIALVHSHVPKLSDAGVVTYDERTRELDYRPDETVERVLGAIRPLRG